MRVFHFSDQAFIAGQRLAPLQRNRTWGLYEHRPEIGEGAAPTVAGLLGDLSARSQMLKEALFEVVRLSQFGDYMPSRTEVLFAWPTLEAAQAGNAKHRIAGVLYQLELESPGQARKLDSRWLNCNDRTVAEIMNYAHHYWSGRPSPTPLPEILYRGSAYVVARH